MNENSALKLMGYQITGTTKEGRWAVLEKAVPILGQKRDIKLRKGQKDGLTNFITQFLNGNMIWQSFKKNIIKIILFGQLHIISCSGGCNTLLGWC